MVQEVMGRVLSQQRPNGFNFIKFTSNFNYFHFNLSNFGKISFYLISDAANPLSFQSVALTS